MKKLKKIINVAVIFMLCATSNISYAVDIPASYIADIPSVSDGSKSCAEYGVNPYADVLEISYRLHNGVWQYRRWNRSTGCWGDPDWIDV